MKHLMILCQYGVGAIPERCQVNIVDGDPTIMKNRLSMQEVLVTTLKLTLAE